MSVLSDTIILSRQDQILLYLEGIAYARTHRLVFHTFDSYGV